MKTESTKCSDTFSASCSLQSDLTFTLLLLPQKISHRAGWSRKLLLPFWKNSSRLFQNRHLTSFYSKLFLQHSPKALRGPKTPQSKNCSTEQDKPKKRETGFYFLFLTLPYTNLPMPSSHNTPPSENPPEAREELTGLIHINPSLLEETRQSVRNLEQLREKLQQLQQPTGITPFFHTLLVAAISLDTSYIHVEPEEGKAQLRLRIDGMLHDLMEIPFPLYENLLSRIKLVSEVKLNVADKPQDGRFSFELTQGELIEVRTATLPAEYGESLVLRVLNPRSLITIEELGLKGSMLQLLKQELFKPNGMIIATGPTGSGKTTTLYAFLKEIVKPEIKIVTIEDPIEYHLEGISQTQVNPEKGYDFASGLEAIVRQDPDIILVGEIRDKETAQIAIQAALTGHLVLSI